MHSLLPAPQCPDHQHTDDLRVSRLIMDPEPQILSHRVVWPSNVLLIYGVRLVERITQGGVISRGEIVILVARWEAKASPDVITDALQIFSRDVYVLLDPGSTLSYVTFYVAVGFGFEPKVIVEPFTVSTLVGDSVVARRVYRNCVVSILSCDTVADLILDMVGFDAILGMDWLHLCYAILDCRTRKSVSVVNEFLEVFSEDLPGIPPDREIDFAFMNLMNRVFRQFLDLFVIVFIDDILISSKSEEDHANHLRIILQTLEDHQLYVKFSKCEFWLYAIAFLGHIMSSDGIEMDPQKIKAVRKWSRPHDSNRYSELLGPGRLLKKKKVKFEWPDSCENSFEKLKDKLTTAPVLTFPEGVDGLVVYCNASPVGLGCILMQHERVELRQRHWMEILKDYDMSLHYHLGKANIVADALVGQQKVISFEIGGDGILRYQGRLYVSNVDRLRKRILDEAYTSRYVVHPGSTKMYHDLKTLYWWNNMKRDVADFVSKCLNCQQVKVEHLRLGGLGTQVNVSTTLHPQTDGQAERTIQTLEDMLRACVIDFKGSWVDYLPLIEFAYNNSYYASIKMAPFEALYGRRCRSPIGWYEVGETRLFGPDLIHQAMEDVKLIRERLKTAQSHQKSYADVRRRELEFEVGDWVFLKVSPMKGVMRLGKKGKLSPRYIGPYRIVKKIGGVAYELELPANLGFVHSVFHISMLKKCIGDHSLVLPVEEIKVTDSLSYEEEPVAILDRKVRNLRSKEIASVKVLWRNQKVEEVTWELKDDMRNRYPNLLDPVIDKEGFKKHLLLAHIEVDFRRKRLSVRAHRWKQCLPTWELGTMLCDLTYLTLCHSKIGTMVRSPAL
ncbi:hypothetical protein FXO38_28845 [Capsicum annuum]|nr:hypothetical protein FXO38_28845 [Capsicum annuum]